MKKPRPVTLSIAYARWLPGFLASQHDKFAIVVGTAMTLYFFAKAK